MNSNFKKMGFHHFPTQILSHRITYEKRNLVTFNNLFPNNGVSPNNHFPKNGFLLNNHFAKSIVQPNNYFTKKEGSRSITNLQKMCFPSNNPFNNPCLIFSKKNRVPLKLFDAEIMGHFFLRNVHFGSF